MMLCYFKYRMWTNQYAKENFHKLSASERELLGKEYLEKGKIRDSWQADFRKNRKFLIKYTNIKYEKPYLRKKRNKAYTNHYNTGKNLFVEYDVNLSRQHYLPGTITIGDNVLLAKHVFIDYSGEVIIHDNVKITDGVSIESHSHPGFTSTKTGYCKSEKLEIFENVSIGSKSFITESCHSIGRHAKIGAGSVVRRNIPPYAIVIGNPAKIIGFVFTPEQMVDFEEKNYPKEKRTSLEKYTNLYNKYYKDRIKEINNYLKL